ncbi:UPF0280 family protein [Chloroflexota bacterium]
MEPRTYRHWIEDRDLISFNVTVKETDLYIRASTSLRSKARRLVLKYRGALEKYIERTPDFLTALKPLHVDKNAPQIAREMAKEAQKVNVGPMAGVAGAVAEFVGEELLPFSPEIVVENGGDIYLKSLKKRVVGIYAGKSVFTGKLGVEIAGEDTPLGICTSSGTFGHSQSFGKADAVIAISQSAILADVTATAIGNLIHKPADIPGGIEFAKNIDGLKGVVIIKDDDIGVWGEVKLCPT